MFEPDEDEIQEENRFKKLYAANYAAVVIPQEVKQAWFDMGTADSNLARLKVYPRMSASMKADHQRYLRMQSESRTIISRFFATVSTDNSTGITG